MRPPDAAPEGPRKAERQHYMDAARCVLLTLGVVLHAANVYIPNGTWLLRDDGHEAFRWISDTLHLFRIPTFFVIAGFFTAYTLPRRGPRQFLRIRLQRLGVPFIAAALVLNLPQVRLLQDLHVDGIRHLSSPLPDGFWFGAEWIFHLWFLLTLMILVGATVALVAWAPTRRSLATLGTTLATRLRPGAVTWALTLIAIAGLIVAGRVVVREVPMLDQPWWWIGYPQMLLYYAAFFVLGVAICAVRPVSESFLRPSWLLLAVSVALLALLPWLLQEDGPLLDEAARRFVQGIGVVVLCQWTLIAFRTFADVPSRAIQYLSDASYSIYLFHHLAVMLIAVSMVGWDRSPFVKFPIVVIGAFALSLGAHHFGVLRSGTLRFLFNGKTDVTAARRARVPHAGALEAPNR